MRLKDLDYIDKCYKNFTKEPHTTEEILDFLFFILNEAPTIDAIPVEDVAGMLAFAHNGKLPCDLEWYECKKKTCTNGDRTCWLQVLMEGELEE